LRGIESFLDVAQFGIAIKCELQRRIGQSRGVLRHMGDRPNGGNFEIAGFGMQLAPQQGKERGFSAAVGADQADLPSGMKLKAGAIDEKAAIAGKSKITQKDHVAKRGVAERRQAPFCGEMRVIRYFKESVVSFRFFLLSLCLMAAAAKAQENTAPETPPAAATPPASAPATATPDKAAPTVVPLDAAALLTLGLPRSKAERDEMAERAVTLKEESRLRKEQAEKTLTDAKPTCWKKFLVSSCLDDARVAYRKDLSIAKRQERESQTLERNVRKYDAAEHVRLRDEENAKRDETNARKAADYRSTQEAKDKARAEKQSQP